MREVRAIIPIWDLGTHSSTSLTSGGSQLSSCYVINNTFVISWPPRKVIGMLKRWSATKNATVVEMSADSERWSLHCVEAWKLGSPTLIKARIYIINGCRRRSSIQCKVIIRDVYSIWLILFYAGHNDRTWCKSVTLDCAMPVGILLLLVRHLWPSHTS